MKGKRVPFSVWLSTFWQQSRAISETGWLPSLPQFCSNEGAVLPKQTGSLEMYLNYLLNPGSLSYLPANGPAARHSALQCHSSLKLQRREQVRLLRVGKATTHALWWHTDEAPGSVSSISRHYMSQCSNRTEWRVFIFLWKISIPLLLKSLCMAALFCWSSRILSLFLLWYLS